jgi:glycosyltransferase involved in cell wall biosynthesis
MKLLVFAHTPPPHHGQSYMVKLMLEAFGGDRRKGARSATPTEVECYHVNCRYSEGMEDIGSARLGKVWLALRYCLEAIWCRFRYGVEAFYYIPGPGKRAALYRDWITMLLCRPFFPKVIFHWHAVGLGDWLEREGNWLERSLTERLLGRPRLSISLAMASMRDAQWIGSRHVEIVPNGIPDPWPDYETKVRGRREARLAARARLLAGQVPTAADRDADGGDPTILRVLFLSHCTAEKGLFDTLEAVAIANKRLRESGAPWSMRLTVAGLFVDQSEEAEFQRRIVAEDLAGTVDYVGFVSGEVKAALLLACDTLCFPTYYAAESFGLVMVEAMAAGMNVVATRWRANAEVLPADHPGLVALHAPEEIADRLIETFARDAAPLRDYVLQNFTVARSMEKLKAALRSVE